MNITAVRLMELMLQALIYAESANLRHIPQLLCFIYYIARESQEFKEVRRGICHADVYASLFHVTISIAA